jgi:hypothetical protein
MARIIMHINYNIFRQHYEEKVWISCYETTNLTATWGEVQHAFISRLSDVHSERQAIVALRKMKEWKHETVENYDRFL